MELYHWLLLVIIQFVSIWKSTRSEKVFATCVTNASVQGSVEDCRYCIGDNEGFPSNYTCEQETLEATMGLWRIYPEPKFNETTGEITWDYKNEMADNVTITFYSWPESDRLGRAVRGCCGISLSAKKCLMEECVENKIFWSITINGGRAAYSTAFTIHRCDGGVKRRNNKQVVCYDIGSNNTQSSERGCFEWDLQNSLIVRFVEEQELTSAKEFGIKRYGPIFKEVCSFYMEEGIVDSVGAEINDQNIRYFKSIFGVPLRSLNVSRNGTNVIIMHGAQPSGLSVMCETKDLISEIESGLNFTNEAGQTMCFFTYRKLDASVASVGTYCAVTKEKPTRTPELTPPTSWLLPIVWCGCISLLLVCVIILYRLTKMYKNFIESTKVINLEQNVPLCINLLLNRNLRIQITKSLAFDETVKQDLFGEEVVEREEAVALTEEEKKNFLDQTKEKDADTDPGLHTQQEIPNIFFVGGYITRHGDVIVSSSDDQSGDSGVSSAASPTTPPDFVVFEYQTSSDRAGSSSLDSADRLSYESSDRRLQIDTDDSGRPLSALESRDSGDRRSSRDDVFIKTEFPSASVQPLEPLVTEEEMQICQRLFGFGKNNPFPPPAGQQSVGVDLSSPTTSVYSTK